MSSVLKLALILLAAAALALLARGWFVSRTPEPPPQALRIRAAAAALPAGLLLREGDLEWRAVAADRLPKGALAEGTAGSELHGALMRGAKPAGALILEGDVIRPDAPGFLAAALKPGMRAVSVPVNDVSGNAGLIQPGDFVDIILTQKLSQAGKNGARATTLVVSETVVERVRIIAVGSRFQGNAQDNKPSRARTITFEVAPRAAEAVTVATQLGSLSMALRSFAVEEREARADAQAPAASVVAWDSASGEERRPVWGGDVSRVLDGTATENSQGPAAPRRVLILRGSQRQQQEFDTHAR
ncbi:Flp pilus assembly protein CpaB [Stutzerimonas kirkiae]|uniref:Flp pilus assembly protein CpaB n=1 Tax=Stutzerimonas kirkiae TaxID=2211392 RepID=A0A4Q9R2K4_9GAMM|nr:Flp pilus assembly protein CpaB [Stutzerimonas kirkiae]TBU93533.1 Flp pilus assembly protein CpaB [Stutzerimonas kirkiae]TBV01739.1 Flp pilus assembly protein CpaB [Stutzerimonas kirkiae]TBV11070.1 Flp pilus assembly protein CpaB [Stutzerimonas kirkiae]